MLVAVMMLATVFIGGESESEKRKTGVGGCPVCLAREISLASFVKKKKEACFVWLGFFFVLICFKSAVESAVCLYILHIMKQKFK